MAKYCPDCGAVLGGRISCACGWKEDTRPDIKGPDSVQRKVPGCCVSGCPMPGTVSDELRPGPNGWMCSIHYRNRYNPEKQAEITKKLIQAKREHETKCKDLINGE